MELDAPIPGAPNFTMRELTRTSHRAYLDDNRNVPEPMIQAGYALAEQLQIIRDHYRKPLIVHSAYRCPPLNRAIGGSRTSQHMKFEAADFHVAGVSLQATFAWIVKDSGMEWGQLIREGWDPAAGDLSWLHISLGPFWRPAHKSQQVLDFSIRTGRYTVYQGPR